MTIPSLLFAFLIALLYGALYHLIRGGSFWRLLLYLALSAVGFFAGHFIGLWRNWVFAMLGQLNLGPASIGSVAFLVIGDWLSRIEVKRETEV